MNRCFSVFNATLNIFLAFLLARKVRKKRRFVKSQKFDYKCKNVISQLPIERVYKKTQFFGSFLSDLSPLSHSIKLKDSFTSMKSYPACLSKVHFLISPHSTLPYFLGRNFFCSRHFSAARIFTWHHYCNRNWSGCGRPKARGQERAGDHTPSLPWQGID